MAQSFTSCNAVGGRIRTHCSRCQKVLFIEIAPETRKKIVRCSCGKSSAYVINYRRSSRTSSSIRANAVLSNAREARIQVCDTSSEGIGFLIPPEYRLSLHRGDEVRIKYRAGSGTLAQRRLLIKNINGNRVGGQYA
jgi:hypothetical protein